METAARDDLYEWRPERSQEPFRREQIFRDRTYEEIPAAEMYAQVQARLDALDPEAVAIISYSTPDARAALAWCRLHHRTAVLMSATKADDAPRVAWREQVKRRLIAQYDAALVGGTPQRAYLESLGFPPSLIFQPYNAVDNAFFAEGAAGARLTPLDFRHLPGLSAGRPFFLASNRFLPIKNLSGLLQAYHRYRIEVSAPWPLLLLGDGPERAALESLVTARRIGGVTFCGFQQIEALPAYYGLAGAFVHPSFKDTWGLVVNEAMAAGLPVLVSARAGCTADLVHDGENGYAFDPDDLDGMANLLKRTSELSDAQRGAMGQRSREIVARWSPEAFAEGLWSAVVAGRPRADRAASFSARLLLWTMQKAAREVNAFHSVPD